MKILNTIRIGQPRGIYELLSLMYINLKFEELSFHGLCKFNVMLLDRGLISTEEFEIISDYITNNPPLRYKIAYIIDSEIFNDYVFCMNGGFYWRRDAKRPRLRWLKKHMRKNKNN